MLHLYHIGRHCGDWAVFSLVSKKPVFVTPDRAEAQRECNEYNDRALLFDIAQPSAFSQLYEKGRER